MTTIATLVVKLVGDIADYSASLQQSQDMTESFSNRAVSGLADLGGGIVMGALAAGTTAVVGLGTAAWQAGETIDGAMDVIQTQTGATGEALNGLRGTFDAVFSQVPASAETSATVIAALNTRLGMTGGILEETSVKFLNMTNLLGGDASTNAALFARVVGDWSVPLEENSVLLDKLFVASQKTGVPVEKLMTNVVQFGAPLRNMNFGLDESIALFAKWEKEGVNAELVMGSLRIAAGKFAEENIPLRKGLEDTFDAIKNAKSSSEALSVAMEIFGSRAAGDMSAAIREGRFDIDDMTQALGGAEGAINKTTAATADWPEMWQKVSNTMTVSLAPIGDTLRGVTGGAIEMLSAWLSKPEAQEFIQDVADGVAWLGEKAQEYLPKIGGWIEGTAARPRIPGLAGREQRRRGCGAGHHYGGDCGLGRYQRNCRRPADPGIAAGDCGHPADWWPGVPAVRSVVQQLGRDPGEDGYRGGIPDEHYSGRGDIYPGDLGPARSCHYGGGQQHVANGGQHRARIPGVLQGDLPGFFIFVYWRLGRIRRAHRQGLEGAVGHGQREFQAIWAEHQNHCRGMVEEPG